MAIMQFKEKTMWLSDLMCFHILVKGGKINDTEVIIQAAFHS